VSTFEQMAPPVRFRDLDHNDQFMMFSKLSPAQQQLEMKRMAKLESKQLQSPMKKITMSAQPI
jgi:hypothetical protein